MDKLKEKISIAEGQLVGLLLKEPKLIDDYDINRKNLSTDGLFYIGIINKLLEKGIEVIDEVSFVTEVDNLGLKDLYEKYGGYKTIKELSNIVNVKNADGIVDDWMKWQLIKHYYEKGFLNIEMHWDKLLLMNSNQVVSFMEHGIADTDLNVCTDINIENLNLTDEEIDDILDGTNIGINYGKHSPTLNYMTMGLPKGDLTMFTSYTNGGKSSYVMNNIIIPCAEQKVMSAIVANEQRSLVFKLLLQTYVLTERLNYWKIDRKKLKSGKWSDEDRKMIEKARKIIREEYAPYIHFIKLFTYDMSTVKKIAKKLSKQGLEILCYDTMKYSGNDESTWTSLINDSKDLFQICSKENLAGVVTFQLAPNLKSKVRCIDVDCLANGKQVAEVFSEMIGWRDIWNDEFEDEPCDIKPYRLKKDANGKFTNQHEKVVLDRNKKYKIFFLFKTRNDDVGNALVYEFKGYQNKWIEVARCTPHQKNRY